MNGGHIQCRAQVLGLSRMGGGPRAWTQPSTGCGLLWAQHPEPSEEWLLLLPGHRKAVGSEEEEGGNM